MSVGDYVILAIIAVWFIVAVGFLIRQHRQGKSACGCGGGGGCAGCSGGGAKGRVTEIKENNCGCTGGSGCAGCRGCHSGKNG